MDTTKTIKISERLDALNGQGLEYLVDHDGNVIAKFVDGNFLASAGIGSNDERTITLQ